MIDLKIDPQLCAAKPFVTPTWNLNDREYCPATVDVVSSLLCLSLSSESILSQAPQSSGRENLAWTSPPTKSMSYTSATHIHGQSVGRVSHRSIDETSTLLSCSQFPILLLGIQDTQLTQATNSPVAKLPLSLQPYSTRTNSHITGSSTTFSGALSWSTPRIGSEVAEHEKTTRSVLLETWSELEVFPSSL